MAPMDKRCGSIVWKNGGDAENLDLEGGALAWLNSYQVGAICSEGHNVRYRAGY